MTDDPADAIRVLVNQQRVALSEKKKADAVASRLDRDIGEAERLLTGLGSSPAGRNTGGVIPVSLKPPVLRPWTELVEEALIAVPDEVSFVDLLAADEMTAAAERLSGWNQEFRGIHRLRGRDYAVAGAAGILAGLAACRTEFIWTG
jgi:hypothetical protein